MYKNLINKNIISNYFLSVFRIRTILYLDKPTIESSSPEALAQTLTKRMLEILLIFKYYLFSEIKSEQNQPKLSAEEIQKAKNYATNLHKTIESPKTYDKYINNIIENDLGKIKNDTVKQNENEYSNKTATIPVQSLETHSNSNEGKSTKARNLKLNVATINNYGFLDEETESTLIENEFKCKSLVKLEEKEYLDQIITTTTTVRTKTTDDLFFLFDNNFYETENNTNVNLNLISNGSINRLNQNNCNYVMQNIGNVNQSVYSSLTNYFSK